MASNLHRIPLAWVVTLALTGLWETGVAQTPCPPRAGTLVAQGYTLLRSDSITQAGERFGQADRLCTRNLDAKVGLGYVALRQGRIGISDSLFQLVIRADSSNADAWEGLTLAAWQSGDHAKAMTYGRRAIGLHPKNPTVRNILNTIDPEWERPPLRKPVRPSRLQLVARAKGDGFEVQSRGAWRPFYIKGVNMGVALPGKFPSEFPTDSTTYAGWLDTIAALHANTLRVYTILPPAFYRALRGWNLVHVKQPLWLIHGVWTELPPEHDFDDSTWKAGFRQEMRRVVDLLHGAAQLRIRPGHAAGRYDADVSRWTLAYIIGREWEPFAVKEFDAKHPGTRTFRGQYLATGPAPAMDVWMAEQCDYLLGYEVLRYNALKPIAYTNWPTLDPLHHITESTGDEESAWREKVGRPVPIGSHEYENDAIGLDAMLVRPTTSNPAGWFASYHAYPYYPDFMINDPGYDTAQSSEGRSNYFGYLHELKQQHAGIPLLIAEYGVPSSRGLAHLQPQGWNHGGLDETEMARIDARLTREIKEAGAAGGIVFAWIDEWFKKNWIVIDYEIPLENTRQWHNVMDAEQNYGLLGMYAGEEERTPVPGGILSRWLALEPFVTDSTAQEGAPRVLRVGSDESYLYLAVELDEMKGKAFPWDTLGIRIALDTWSRNQGQTRLPGTHEAGDIGFEFLAELHSPDDAQLLVTPDYNPFVGAEAIVHGDDFAHFARRPISVTQRNDGRFDSLFIITNRARFGRDGTFYPASGYNRGRLRFGRYSESTLADWYYEPEAGLLELRLPWGLINVTDPSTGTLILGAAPDGPIQTTRAEGFRLGVMTVAAQNEKPVGALPHLGSNGAWHAADFPNWTWNTWDSPKYHQELKPVYDSLKVLWGSE
ncbi:MAG TPA: hypothetical protein VLK88_16735 [Gemmatimonadales bacterium]|nr:hypothetical protein [Gemmatimonadales bacterium]